MSTDAAVTALTLSQARAAFRRVPGYLNAATLGLPTTAGLAAVRQALDTWEQGGAAPAVYDEAVAASRAAYARLAGVPVNRVAVGSQVSAMLAPFAAAVPDGAEVLAPADDFASVLFPFLVHADRGVRVRLVPLEALADEVGPQTWGVAFSLVQSADGRVADAAAVVGAAREQGALTFCDLTQAAGWLPVDAGSFDVTVCTGYKWLCSPRGTGFVTTTPAVLERVRPVSAGWYAGASVWDSIYGPRMHLAEDARRLDVSPAWLSWVGTAPALELLAAVGAAAVRDHDVGLASAVRRALGVPPSGSAVVSLADPDGRLQRRLTEAGGVVAGRAGRVRISFHLWNDEEDVDLVLRAVGAT